MTLSLHSGRRQGPLPSVPAVAVRQAWLVAHAVGFAAGLVVGGVLVAGLVLALVYVG